MRSVRHWLDWRAVGATLGSERRAAAWEVAADLAGYPCWVMSGHARLRKGSPGAAWERQRQRQRQMARDGQASRLFQTDVAQGGSEASSGVWLEWQNRGLGGLEVRPRQDWRLRGCSAGCGCRKGAEKRGLEAATRCGGLKNAAS